MSEYFRKYIKKESYPLHPSQIKFKTFFINCIPATMSQRGYKKTDDDDWNIYWCEKQFLNETLDRIRLFPNKRVNHFRNWYEICRKDLMSKNIKRYKKALQKQGKGQQASSFNFTPLTYNLPTEYPIFLQQFKRSNKGSIWIMKPIGRSQGKGIFLFNRIGDISQWSEMQNQPQPYIVQRYIHNPLVIGHKKFDMRIYVLVTAHNPLTIYLYRSGFGRFTHVRYEQFDLNNLQSHLTNVAIQKNADNYDEDKGGKYLLDKLRLYLLSKYPQEKVIQCFYNAQEIVIKTLLATSKLMATDKRCFQLYGFDIMIDANLKPWLIQINGSPSMTANTIEDEKLKKGLLDDTLTIVNLEQILAGEEQQIGGFDLVYKNGNRTKPNVAARADRNPHIFMNKEYSLLGCFNNRDQNMRRMAKMTALRMAEEAKKNQTQVRMDSVNNTRNPASIQNRNNQGLISNRVPGQNMRGRSIAMGVQRSTNKTNNNQGNSFSSMLKKQDESLKLPKVISNSTNYQSGSTSSSSNKYIQTSLKKPSEGIFRVNASRESKR